MNNPCPVGHLLGDQWEVLLMAGPCKIIQYFLDLQIIWRFPRQHEWADEYRWTDTLLNTQRLVLLCQSRFWLQFCHNASSLHPVPYPASHFLKNLQSVFLLKFDILYPCFFLMLLPLPVRLCSSRLGRFSSGFRGPAKCSQLNSFDPLLSSAVSSVAHSRY